MTPTARTRPSALTGTGSSAGGTTRPSAAARARPRTARRRRTDAAYYAAMGLLVMVFAFPVLWAVSLSLKTGAETLQSPPSLLPADPQWGNYAHVLDTTPIGRYLLNSLVLVVTGVGGTLLIGLPAAYALSRTHGRRAGRRHFSRLVLAAQLLSPLIVAVPAYRLFVGLGLINDYFGLILVYVAISAPFTTWFLKTYLDTVPTELDEAGRVDGCSRLRAVVSVVLPAARPGIVSAVIVGGVTTWSQFVIPFVLLDDPDLAPVSVGVVNLQATSGEITTPYLAAGSVLAVLPVLLLFVALQRYIVGALTAGAVKG